MAGLKMSIEEYNRWGEEEDKPKNRSNSILLWIFIIFGFIASNVITYTVVDARVNNKLSNFEKRLVIHNDNMISDKIFNIHTSLLKNHSDITKRLDHVESKLDVLEYSIDNVYDERYYGKGSLTIRK